MRKLLPVEKLIGSVFVFLDLAAEDPLPAPKCELLEIKLKLILATLTEEEQSVLALRYGLGDGHEYTLEQASRVLKITKDRIRKVERETRLKLTKPLVTWNLHRIIKEVGLSELAGRIQPKLDSLPKIYQIKEAS